MTDNLKCEKCKGNFEQCFLNNCSHRVCQKCRTDGKCSVCGQKFKHQIEDFKLVQLLELNKEAQNHLANFKKREAEDISVLEAKLKEYIKIMLGDHYRLYKGFTRQHEWALQRSRNKREQLLKNARSKEEETQIEARHLEEMNAINARQRMLMENFCEKYAKYLKERQIPLLNTKNIEITLLNKKDHFKIIINSSDNLEGLIKKIENKIGSKLKLNKPNTILCFGSSDHQTIEDLTPIYEKYLETGILPGNVDEVKDNTESLTSKYSLKENSEIVFFGEVDY